MSKVLAGRENSADCFHNLRVKLYPDGSYELLISDKAIFREDGYEDADKWEADKRANSVNPGEPGRAISRAKAKLRDLALCTKFEYFVTLTTDNRQVNRHDDKAVLDKLKNWLDNNVRRRGLTYVIVPERHKDGAIHFHGFFNGALEAVWSGTMIPPAGGKPRRVSKKKRPQRLSEGWRDVFNLPAWSLGWTTAITLYGDYGAAVSYVCKYIGKAVQGKNPEKIGGRWYYSGGQLGHPEILLSDGDIRDYMDLPEAYNFNVPGVACYTKLFVKGENSIERCAECKL